MRSSVLDRNTEGLQILVRGRVRLQFFPVEKEGARVSFWQVNEIADLILLQGFVRTA